MATEGYFESWQVLVGTDDLSTSAALHKAVTHAGNFAADLTMCAGILKSKGKAGQEVRVAVDGTVKAYVGAAVTTPGCPLTVTTSGFLAVGTHTLPFLGRLAGASAPANSGDLVTMVMV